MRQIAFQANWTPQNYHLQSNYKGIFQSEHLNVWQKISLAFRRIMESIGSCVCPQAVKSVARTMIVPATLLQQQPLASRMEQEWMQKWEGPDQDGHWTQLRNAYEPVQLFLKTPDGECVNGIFYRHRRSADRDIPTILCFDGNGGSLHGSSWDWLLKKGSRSPQPFHVIALNYASSDLKGSKDLVLCGETFFQAARDALGISESNLHFLGFSLGGAIAALVHDLHPLAGRMVNLNSFESLKKLIRNPLGPLRIVRYPCLKEILSQLGSLIGWDIEPARALRHLKEKTLFVFNRRDEIIHVHDTAALATAPKTLYSLFQTRRTVETSDQVIELQLKNTRASPSSHHNAPLSLYEDGTGFSISKRIVNFILGRDVFPRI